MWQECVNPIWSILEPNVNPLHLQCHKASSQDHLQKKSLAWNEPKFLRIKQQVERAEEMVNRLSRVVFWLVVWNILYFPIYWE